MNNGNREALDIELATIAHAMFAKLLTPEEKKRIAALRGGDELIACLRRTEGWGEAARALPSQGATAEDFSIHMERAVYAEYDELYRLAAEETRDFLIFISLRIKCRAILTSLRRLAFPNAPKFVDPLPPYFYTIPNLGIASIPEAATFQEIIDIGGKGIYGDVLRALRVNEATGLPDLSEAAEKLEGCYYSTLDRYLREKYTGADKKGLLENIGFRADMLNLTYLLRLRRFGTPEEKVRGLLLPIRARLDDRTITDILAAGSDEAVSQVLLRCPYGALMSKHAGKQPEKIILDAQTAYARRIIRGTPSLCTADAFMYLKESECNMLKRVFVALRYGLDPAVYM